MNRAGIGALVFVSVLAGFEGAASAACVPPVLSLSESTVVAGSAVVVSGSDFYAECTDTAPPGGVPPPLQPATGIRVLFVQAGQETLLTVTDANVTRAFSVTVQVPATASPGPATITARVPGTDEISASASVTVARAQVAPETPSGQQKSLPHTGGLPFLLLALVTLQLGLVILLYGGHTLDRARHRH